MTDAAVAAAAAGMLPARLDAIVRAFTGLVDAKRLPGAVLHIERRGHVALHTAVGLLGSAASGEMRTDSIFRIHSMTKPVVSVAALQLFEQGALRLDDPVSRWLPEFASARVLAEVDGGETLLDPPRPMTLHDLLRHTAGLTYEFQPPSPVRRRYVDAGLDQRTRSNAELAATIASLPLQYAPGSCWEYSRASDVLGRVVEVVSGRALGEHLRRALFEPLGMADTGYYVPAAQHARIAEPFASDPDGSGAVTLNDLREPMPLQSGGTGLASTAGDYARFCRMLLQQGAIDRVRILGRKTVEFMTADHLGAIPVVDPALPTGHGFGLGVAVRLATGLSHIPGSRGTWGWGGSAGTLFFVDPAEDLLAVLMTQAPAQCEELQQRFRVMTYAALG